MTRHMCVLANAEFVFKTQKRQGCENSFPSGGFISYTGSAGLHTAVHRVGALHFPTYQMTMGTSCINKFTKWGVSIPPECAIH